MHIFLAGLDGEFEQICGEIFRKDPIPELEACCDLVFHESVQLTTMIGELEKYEASSMVTRNRSNQNRSSQSQPKNTDGADKSTYKCTHCNQTGHTKSHYFELLGYPDWWDHIRDSRKKNSKRTLSVVVLETKKMNGVAGHI